MNQAQAAQRRHGTLMILTWLWKAPLQGPHNLQNLIEEGADSAILIRHFKRSVSDKTKMLPLIDDSSLNEEQATVSFASLFESSQRLPPIPSL